MFSALHVNRWFSSRFNRYYQSCYKIGLSQRPNQAFSQLFYCIQVENRMEDKLLSVKWDDDNITNYPHIYLRDHCPCPSCYNPQTRKRIISNLVINNYDKATIKTAHINHDSNKLLVEWMNDGPHTSSSYQLDWLKTHRLLSPAENQQHRIKRRLWDSHTKHNIPRFDFNKVLNDKLQLYDWLQSILQNGAAFIDNVPKEIGQLKKITQQVTDLRQSFYGKIFQVKSLGEDAATVAYQNQRLPLHSDFSFINSTPGIVILHCIATAMQGGESQLCDTFKAAEMLRHSHPEYFDLLVQYPIEYEDKRTINAEFFFMSLHPVISLFHNGEIKQVCYSDHTRTSNLHVPQELVANYYKALAQFLKYVYSSDAMVQFKLQPGIIMALDNYRILHGRTAFDILTDSHRHLEGGHIDWDGVMSYMRVFERDYHINNKTPSM